MTNPDDAAFPVRLNPKDPNSENGGLTKREWYAGQAMVGISIWDAMINDKINAGKVEQLAQSCVNFADALIEELNKPKENAK